MNRTMTVLSRIRWQVAGVLVFTLLSLVLTSLVAGTLSKGGTGATVRIKAQFRDATGLKKGDDVRIAGVRVGQVARVALDGTRALVTLEIARDQPVYDTTVAKIDYLNLMGQRYVGLSKPAGAAAKLRNGSTIPLSRTEQGLDLTAMFNAFRPLFTLIQPGDVNELGTNIIQVLQGQGGALQHLTDQTAKITATLVDRDAVIGAVIENVGAVMGTLESHRTEISSMVTQLNGLTATVARNRAQIGATIDGVSGLVRAFSGTLTTLGPTVTRDVASLRDWAVAFARQSPALAGSLSDTQVLLEGYVKSLGLGSFLNTYFCKVGIQLGDRGPTVPLNPSPQRSRRCQ
ncbi:MAG: MCE family protein [Propionibacteriales bacterium]|nr:MCE family protein [Propionibacteriales bacterium]